MSNTSNQYFPDLVTAPGEILLEKLEEIGMTQAELASRIGRTKKMVNEIIKGKAPILSETALRLERVLSIPARFWSNLEAQYRESQARQQERTRLAEHLPLLKKLPVKKMVQLGWLPAHTDPIATLQEVLSFFGVASIEAFEQLGKQKCLAFRQSAVHQVDPYAILAWIRKGELAAHACHCDPYDEHRFKKALEQIRKLTREPVETSIRQMIALCASAGVALVLVPELPGTRAWGVTHLLTKQSQIRTKP